MFLTVSSLIIYTVSSGWSYNDIDSWGSSTALEDTSYADWPNSCGSSFKTQSPIHIDPSNIKTSCPSSDKLDWWLNSEINELIVENTGHTIHITPDDSNDYAKLKNNFKTDAGKHSEYKLGSLHLHWGKKDEIGSEHTISGKNTVLEMHFVHYSTDYDSLSDALQDAKKGEPTQDPYVLAVVAVLYEIGEENAFIKAITDSVESIENKGGKLNIHDVNMGQIVPNIDGNNIKDTAKFYYYKGGLTTPPCSPIVQWHILADTMTVSEEQIQKLRDTVKNEDGELLVPNARPVQTNTNSVYYCGKFDF